MKWFKVEQVKYNDGKLAPWYRVAIYREEKRVGESRTEYSSKWQVMKMCFRGNLTNFLITIENKIYGINFRTIKRL